MATITELSKARFREIIARTEKVSVLDARNLRADYSTSMRLLDENGLEALTYQKALALAWNGGRELGLATVDMWFYLKGTGDMKELRGYEPYKKRRNQPTFSRHTFTEEGRLNTYPSSISLDDSIGHMGRFVDLWEGENPLLFQASLVPDTLLFLPGSILRGAIRADCEPNTPADVVVGIPKDGKIELKLNPAKLLRPATNNES
jgi:hypothetical protein